MAAAYTQREDTYSANDFLFFEKVVIVIMLSLADCLVRDSEVRGVVVNVGIEECALRCRVTQK